MDTKSLAFSTVTSITVVAAMMLNACSSGGDAAAVAPPPPAPAPAPPDVLINVSGGNGGDQSGGGSGSLLQIQKYTGSGPVEIRKEGVVDASFTPFMPSANLGDNPATVSADTTVAVVGAEPAAGTLYFQNFDNILYKSDGDTTPFEPEERVTGLHIEQDVVLTLGLNSGGSAAIYLENDLLNQGAISTHDNSPIIRGGLSLDVSSYFANSEIDTSGRLEGQSGGHTYITARFSIVNHGGINTSGGDNSNGAAGYAGGVNLNAQQGGIENTGILDASGGTSATLEGGDGNNIDINAPTGIRNSGDLLARGGDGIIAAGFGRSINLNINQAGDLLNAGNLDTRGGSATQDRGRPGGPINLMTMGGKLLSSGELISRGGDTGLSSGFYSAGDGASINIMINGEGHNPFTGAPVNVGNLQISGNIDSSGGDAPASGDSSGGNAGSVFIFMSTTHSFYDDGQKVSLLGYDLIDTSGGDGQDGGNGEPVVIENMPHSSSPSGQNPSGNIINEAAIDSSGGDVSATAVGSFNGGCHGFVRFDTGFNQSINQSSPEGAGINNSGAINARSGENLETNGAPGCNGEGIVFWAYSGITNTADLDTSGGNDRGTDGGTTGRGAGSSSVDMRVSNGPVSNSGNVTSKGGDGEYRGGHASFTMEVSATAVDNSGDIDVSGGDANPALSGSDGGNAAAVHVFGSDGLGSVDHTGVLNIDGGTGETEGDDGYAIVGGFCVAGICP